MGGEGHYGVHFIHSDSSFYRLTYADLIICKIKKKTRCTLLASLIYFSTYLEYLPCNDRIRLYVKALYLISLTVKLHPSL